MAIKTNDAAVSVDFAYEDDRTEEVFKVKMHCTQKYGQTISISGNVGGFTSGDDSYLALPINLIIEAIDFLRQNKYIESTVPMAVAPTGPAQTENPMSNMPSLARTTVTPTVSILPMPSIGGVQERPIIEAAKAEPEEQTISEERPLQSLSMPSIQNDEAPAEEEEEEYEEIDASHDGSEGEEYEEAEESEEYEEGEEEVGELTEEEVSEAKRMAKEREVAAKKAAAKPSPKVHRKARKKRKPPRDMNI